MVMKALSLDLVRGVIDQIDQVVNFTWVDFLFLNLLPFSMSINSCCASVDVDRTHNTHGCSVIILTESLSHSLPYLLPISLEE